MVDLTKLLAMGFIAGDLVEAILTTISEDKQPNAAPMGIWVQPESTLIIRPYTDTQTAHNIAQTGEAVINLTQDPRIFLALAFKKELPTLERPEFEAAKKVQAPRLQGMNGYLEVKLIPKGPETSASPFKEFICSIQRIDTASALPMVHSRTRCAAIECVIHATRIRALYREDEEATRMLVSQFDALRNLVDRIAPNSPSAEVIQTITRLLSRWR